MSTTFKLLIGISFLAISASEAAAQVNVSQVTQTGSGNEATVDNNAVGNTGNNSSIIQNGAFNSVTVIQRLTSNRSVVQQLGTTNLGTHQQGGTRNEADSRSVGDFNSFFVTQVGTTNSATLDQNADASRSVVNQGFATTTNPDGSTSGEERATENNIATIQQVGRGVSSTVNQRGASASAPAANGNFAQVAQRGTGSGSGTQQASSILQESRGNSARVTQDVGSPTAANSSIVVQRDSAQLSGAGSSLNSATVSQTGTALNSQITQNGLRNTATATLVGGGPLAADSVRITIDQSGSNLRATARNDRLRGSAGAGNSGTITQTGAGHQADAYQFGRTGTAAITQANGVNSVAYADGTPARATAFLSQDGTNIQATVDQTGDTRADVTQARASGSVVLVTQVDAGDNVGGGRAFADAVVTQYGDGNRTEVRQNAIGAGASTWQQVGSASNVLTVGQGIGATGGAETTGSAGFTAGPTGSGSVNLSASVTQSGRFNRATIAQDGISLTATINQAGIGASGLETVAFVSQTGSVNRATIRQGAGVAPSAAGDAGSGQAGDEFAFAGGARSAEARILQTNSGNSATITQQGRGQRARIEQSGANNLSEITQQADATNATAVIRQLGSGNSYYVVQTVPGQYIVVSQTGSGNSVNSVVQRGDAGGSNGFTPPPQ